MSFLPATSTRAARNIRRRARSPKGTVQHALRRILAGAAALWTATSVPTAAQDATGDPYAGATAPAPAADTLAPFRTRHYPMLQLPQTAWRALVFPLGAVAIHAEHSQFHLRVRDWLTNADHSFGIYPQIQLGGETGHGGGVRLFHTDLFGAGQALDAAYVLARPDRQLAQVLFREPHLWGSALYAHLQGDWLRTDNPGATVNGSVPGEEARERLTGRDDAARFALERADAAALLGWRSHAGPLEEYRPGLYLEGWVGWSRRELRDRYPGSGRDFLLDGERTTAAARSVRGLDQSLQFGRLGARIAWDDRDHRAPATHLSHPLNYLFPGRVLLEREGLYYSRRDLHYPDRGGLLQAEAELAGGADRIRYLRLAAEVQRFQNLVWRDRVLALRARLDRVHELADGLVPFADLPTLGGSQRLRGYKRGNYVGEGALLLAAEYRYPVWDTWNAFLFWEEGQVFDRYRDLQVDRFHSCVGAGLSLRTPEGFLVALRLAHSAEEWVLPGFALEQEF